MHAFNLFVVLSIVAAPAPKPIDKPGLNIVTSVEVRQGVFTAAVSPDGKLLAVDRQDRDGKYVAVYDVRTKMRSFEVKVQSVFRLRFAEEKLVVDLSNDQSNKLLTIDLATQKQEEIERKKPRQLTFAGHRVEIKHGRNSEIHMIKDGKIAKTIKPAGWIQDVNCVQVSPDGRTLSVAASAMEEDGKFLMGTFAIYDQDGREVHSRAIVNEWPVQVLWLNGAWHMVTDERGRDAKPMITLWKYTPVVK